MIKFAERAIKGTWDFVVEVFGQVYKAVVVDTVEGVISAVQWVLHQIQVATEDTFRYVEFLFQWNDIRRTKDVLHNIVSLWTSHQVSELGTIQRDFDRNMDSSAAQFLNGLVL